MRTHYSSKHDRITCPPPDESHHSASAYTSYTYSTIDFMYTAVHLFVSKWTGMSGHPGGNWRSSHQRPEQVYLIVHKRAWSGRGMLAGPTKAWRGSLHHDLRLVVIGRGRPLETLDLHASRMTASSDDTWVTRMLRSECIREWHMIHLFSMDQCLIGDVQTQRASEWHFNELCNFYG